MATTDIGNCPSTAVEREDALLRKAIALAGLTGDIYTVFDDMDRRAIGDYIASVAGSGGGFADTEYAGGWYRMYTDTTAASAYIMAGPNVGAFTTATPAWYMAARMKFLSGVTDDAVIGAGIYNAAANKTLWMGWISTLHATNFTVQYDGQAHAAPGSALDLGVAADQAVHLFEMWGRAGSNVLYARIDEGAVVSATQSSPFTTGATMGQGVRNLAGTTNRVMTSDYWFFACNRT